MFYLLLSSWFASTSGAKIRSVSSSNSYGEYGVYLLDLMLRKQQILVKLKVVCLHTPMLLLPLY